ncbi:hypothetical protein [Aeromicrobium sp. NPDC092404]|uniref:hypothetical protein n=1 Tax=Aeromicrobium sp. NPDC092404 TaxID=3154976 RepID=UPI00343EE05F
MTKTVSLPEIPGSGDELEDYVAALFQASGHFVEKQVVEADPLDLLELDIVTTMYSKTKFAKRLVEVKGGKWGYGDLFKVVGWMEYLNIPVGAFFVKDWFDLGNSAERFQPLGLDVVQYGNFETAADQFEAEGFGQFADPELVGLWRHSYNVERALVQCVFKGAKTGHEGAKSAKSYYKLVNNGTFFARTPEESLNLLYAAYKEHPKISLGYALELDGGTFDPHASGVQSDAYTRAMRGGEFPEVQACMYLEQRARLSILKSAVDYALLHPQGPPALKEGTFTWGDLDFHVLPQSFKSGLEWLMAQDNYALYPTFWQQFLWGWGGFYLTDREAEEFEWMSKYSGIPAAEIPIALEAFDHFFPWAGWFTSLGSAPIRWLKLTPFLFQGIGAHHRRSQYSTPELSNLSLGDFGTHLLGSRINTTVDFLLPD